MGAVRAQTQGTPVQRAVVSSQRKDEYSKHKCHVSSACIRMYVGVSMYICVCMYVCSYVCLSACMHVCMHVCVYVCM